MPSNNTSPERFLSLSVTSLDPSQLLFQSSSYRNHSILSRQLLSQIVPRAYTQWSFLAPQFSAALRPPDCSALHLASPTALLQEEDMRAATALTPSPPATCHGTDLPHKHPNCECAHKTNSHPLIGPSVLSPSHSPPASTSGQADPTPKPTTTTERRPSKNVPRP